MKNQFFMSDIATEVPYIDKIEVSPKWLIRTPSHISVAMKL